MAITSYTKARIVQNVATLYQGESIVSQLVAPQNNVTVDKVSRAASVIKDFVPLSDGTTTALSANTSENNPAGSQNIIPVTFAMSEYGKDEDALLFPWQEFLIDAESPGNYEAIVTSVANKAITAVDQIGTVFVRDTIGGASNSTYTHPLGPDNGGTEFTSPLASKLIRYGTQAVTRAGRANITTADLATWEWVRSMKSTLRDRHVRPLMVTDGGAPVYALIAHDHLIVDLYSSLSLDAFPAVTDWISKDNLAARGIMGGIVGMFEGVLIISSSRMKYASAGSGSIDVYPMVMVGGDFLAKAALSPAAMPMKPADGDIFQVGDGVSVIVTPDYAGVHSNRLGRVAWYGYFGFGIYDPKSYIRVECASTSAGRL